MKAHTWIGQSRWMERCLAHAQIQSEDWFRLAQNRTEWRKRIQQAFPDRTLSPQEHSRLDSWRRGTPLPDNSPPAPNLVPVHVDTPGRYGCGFVECPLNMEMPGKSIMKIVMPYVTPR